MKFRHGRVWWLLGVISTWTLVWFLLGVRVVFQLRDKPHPFLPQIELTGTILKASLEWALTALAFYVVFGILSALVAKLFTSDRQGTNLAKHLGFSEGFLTALGICLFFHGVLFTMVPMGMVGLPGLKHLPMGLLLMLFLGTGAWLLWRRYRAESPTMPLLRTTALLAFLALLPSVPHDIFRKSMPGQPPLPDGTPRVLILGIDGMRRDVLERHMPEWKAPNGVMPACVAPATRRSWSLLLGKDPVKLRNSIIMPFKGDLEHPEEFRLLALAREKGLRTAWAIDDSLTAGFGNQPNLFTTVRESPGGWKYWYTLGMGTIFPVYSWGQNYLAPIENTNPWADIRAFYRDIGRLVSSHHWVFAHTCSLHEPIRSTSTELQTIRPWRWLLDSPWSYRSYVNPEEAAEDGYSRADPRSSALYHFSARARRILRELQPAIQDWEQQFPALSGVLTADHGEYHIELRSPEGELLSHLEGYHGFSLEPYSLWVPLHPFGKTQHHFKPNDNFTWVELRDALPDTISGAPLVLKPREQPLLIQFPTIRATHIETQAEKENKDRQGAGIDPKEILDSLYVFPNGMWFASDFNDERFKNRPLSSGLVQGNNLLLFNPVGIDKFERQTLQGFNVLTTEEVGKKQMEEELAQYHEFLPQPLVLKQPRPVP
jgi:hypothetical protein